MQDRNNADTLPQRDLLTAAQPEDSYWMEQAVLLADQAAGKDEVPVGAVVVYQGAVIGHGYNQPRMSHDPTAHAEIMALREASGRLGNYRLPGCTLYVTIEPCTMCFGAIIHARISRLVYGADEPRYGAVLSGQGLLVTGQYNHKLAVTSGVLSEVCAERMRRFFRERRR